MMNRLNKHLSLYICTVFITACATAPRLEQGPADAQGEAEQITQAAENANSTEAQDEIEYGSFNKEDLFQAIISELGAQRGGIGEATEN